jgi:hypothetical protein
MGKVSDGSAIEEHAMPENTADIIATSGADFVITVDVGTIPQNGAKLITANNPDRDLKVGANGREIAMTNTPSGDSTVAFALVWPPRETRDSTVDVKPGSVSPATATVTVSNPKPTIDNGDTPGFVELFGK